MGSCGNESHMQITSDSYKAKVLKCIVFVLYLHTSLSLHDIDYSHCIAVIKSRNRPIHPLLIKHMNV